MRTGSVLSLSFLVLGLTVYAVLPSDGAHVWEWRNGYVYLMIGIVSLLLTPLTGLLAFLVFSIRQRAFTMAFLIVTLLVLLIGGTWLIHPGH
ncbi:hypothetical protein F9K33_10830 [bacterium]|nr:MAG: hypothetical protein F9K33_10830 [bacterium]